MAFIVDEIRVQIPNNQRRKSFLFVQNSDKDPQRVIKELGFEPADSSEIESMVDEVIANNPDKVAEIKGGNDKLILANWPSNEVK